MRPSPMQDPTQTLWLAALARPHNPTSFPVCVGSLVRPPRGDSASARSFALSSRLPPWLPRVVSSPLALSAPFLVLSVSGLVSPYTMSVARPAQARGASFPAGQALPLASQSSLGVPFVSKTFCWMPKTLCPSRPSLALLVIPPLCCLREECREKTNPWHKDRTREGLRHESAREMPRHRTTTTVVTGMKAWPPCRS